MDANPVIEAVRIVGGPTKASWVCQVSAAAVYRWYKLGYVPDTRAAVRLADATKEAGTPISIAALAGLDVIEGGQPAPDGPGRGRGPRVPKRPARRTSR